MTTQDGMEPLEQALERFFQEQTGTAAAGPAPADAAPSLHELLGILRHGGAAMPGRDEGRMLGGFRLGREVGRGGMGVVFEAVQVSLGRKVAVKLLHEAQGADPAAVVRLRREAETLARLEHPGTVKVHAVGHEQGLPYVVMEWIDGEPLCAGRHDLSRSVELVAQVADALEHAHRCGVVHRDVKPQNIMVRRDGSALLTDFGLARIAGGPGLTQSGAFAGTPCYAAPEQVDACFGEIGPQTDIYGLGATLYELLTSRRPFDGPTSQSVLQQITSREPADPRRLRPELTTELSAIVLKAMEKEPGRRYASAAAMAADLRAYLEHRPVQAQLAGPVMRLRKFVRREPFRAAVLALLAVGIPAIAGLGGYLLRSLPEIAAGQRTRMRARLESLLAAGFAEAMEGSPERAEQLLGEAKALAPQDRDVDLGLALAAGRRQTPALQTEVDPTVELLLAGVGDAAAGDGGQDAAECFLQGMREMHRGEQGDRDAFGRALVLLRRTVLTAPAPRLLYHTQWAHAAGHVRARTDATDAAAALQQLWPDSPEAWRWSEFALRFVDRVAAASAVRRQLERMPSDAPAGDRASAWALLAVDLSHCDEFAGAAEAAQRAIDLEPENDVSWAVLGDARKALGEPEGALAAYMRSLELKQDATTWNAVGCLHDARGEASEAAAAFGRAVGVDPQLAVAWGNLGIVRGRTRDFRGAADAFARVMALRPDDPQPAVQRAKELLQCADKAELRAFLADAVQRFPTEAELVRPLVELCIGRETAQALRDPELAVRVLWPLLHAGGGQACEDWFRLALATAAGGDGRAAAAYAALARERLPADPDAAAAVVVELNRLGEAAVVPLRF